MFLNNFSSLYTDEIPFHVGISFRTHQLAAGNVDKLKKHITLFFAQRMCKAAFQLFQQSSVLLFP